MITKEYQGLKWHEFELLADLPLIHGSFTRHGGYSSVDFQSLNLGDTQGDNPENVQKNLNKISEALNLPRMIKGNLCHGKQVHAVLDADKELPTADGLSTQRENLGLLITQADCQAAIFYDPIQHALTNVHCGWRGNVHNIYESTISHMKQLYDSNPADILVCISPSLGPDHAEFVNYRQELPEPFWTFQIRPLFFDLWAISEWQLKEAGVLPHHIQVAKIDTYANTTDYFSYRRSKSKGRQATVCALKPR